MLISSSFTRDNASNNNTFIEAFTNKYQDKTKQDFHGNIRCFAHINNIAVQTILKAFLSNSEIEEYLSFYANNQFLSENIEKPQNTPLIAKSKLFFFFYFVFLYYF